MKDLENLRKDLTEKVSEIGDEPIKIPNGLKNPFLQEWDRCEKINDGHFVVSFQEGKGTKDLLDKIDADYEKMLAKRSPEEVLLI